MKWSVILLAAVFVVSLAMLSGCGGGGGASDQGASNNTQRVVGLRADFPPRANGVWVYDAKSNGDYSVTQERSGYWATDINAYNAAATASHAITMLYSYGGDLEMNCASAANCSPSDYSVNFMPSGTINSGYGSAQAYAATVIPPPGQSTHVVPVLDGRLGSQYLRYFNQLSAVQARQFADKVAGTVCSDDDVSGIEFDLERFDASNSSQYAFYMQIARDFAGYHSGDPNDDPYNCVDDSHPDGRFFAVFMSADEAKPGTLNADNLRKMLTRYGNGYAIAALYDLASTSDGTLSSVSYYSKQAGVQISNMKSWAGYLGINYAFAIPGGASAHEYTTCSGSNCSSGSGYPMLDYTKAAIEAIDASGARSDTLFIGNDVWFWGPLVHSNDSYMGPALPPLDVLSYLGGSL